MKKFLASLLLLASALTARADSINVSPAFSLPIVGNGATVTASTPLLNLTQTWNNAGVTFTGLLANFTDTASAAASLLMDLQVGGASKVSFNKAGYVTVAGGGGKLIEVDSSRYIGTGGSAFVNIGSGLAVGVTGAGTGLYTGGGLNFQSSFSSSGANVDLSLFRDAANTLAQRNGTNAQAFRVYNTYTDASNYERARLAWSGNVFEVATAAAGSGTARNMKLTAGASDVTLATSGAMTMASGTLTASAPLTQTQTWNSGGTTFTGILQNITDTASAAASLLMNLQVGGQDRFSVRKDTRLAFKAAQVAGANGSGLFSLDNTAIGFGQDAGSSVWAGVTGSGFVVAADKYYGFGSSGTSTPDTFLYRDAANTLVQRNAANAQTFNHYGFYSSATSFTRGAMKHSVTTLSGVSGASVTASNLRPKGADVVGVATTVTTALGTGSGTTGYQIGDGTDADRYGNITGTAIGTDSDNSDATADPTGFQLANGDIVITANGGDFDGTGVIRVDVFYLTTEAD